MARVSDTQTRAVLTDRPAPGRGYLAFITAACAGPPLCILAFFENEPRYFAALALAAVVGAAILAVLLHAAYHTSYSLDNKTLMLRSGILSSRVRLDSIREAIPLASHLGLIGRGMFGAVGFSNRLTDIILIRADKGRYHLSPSDPASFIGLLGRHTADSVEEDHE